MTGRRRGITVITCAGELHGRDSALESRRHVARRAQRRRRAGAPARQLVVFGESPTSAREILQKSSASVRFRGATPEDDRAAREGLGFYCDLQSLNSEDAITWSVFGNLAYLPAYERCAVWSGILMKLGESPLDSIPTCWLWRRLPHPQKEESSGGPEIDFGCLDDRALILGEAKWNSPTGRGQGLAKHQSQLDPRRAYLERHAPKAFPESRRRIALARAVAPTCSVMPLVPASTALRGTTSSNASKVACAKSFAPT